MERLLTPKDIAERLSVSLRTARTYMATMPHLRAPLRVSEADLARWEDNRTVIPQEAQEAPQEAPRRARRIRFDLAPEDRIPRRKT